MFHIPDGSSLECLGGFYPHNKFPEECTPGGGGVDCARCYNRSSVVYGAVSVRHN